MTLPGAEDFRKQLNEMFKAAELLGFDAVEISAGRLHGTLIKKGEGNRFPIVSNVLWEAVRNSVDETVYSPPKGKGPRLRIRYQLPR